MLYSCLLVNLCVLHDNRPYLLPIKNMSQKVINILSLQNQQINLHFHSITERKVYQKSIIQSCERHCNPSKHQRHNRVEKKLQQRYTKTKFIASDLQHQPQCFLSLLRSGESDCNSRHQFACTKARESRC